MHERDSREQAATLIWAIRVGTILLLTALLLISAASSKAKAGIGFEYARSSERVVYAGGAVALQFELSGDQSPRPAVEVVRRGAGVVVAIPASSLPPATPLAVDWSGTNAYGRPGKPGRYSWRIRHPGSGKVVRLKGVRGKRNFSMRSSLFPVRGPYDFGGSQARFGAGRSGHSHQGQDVFAACGTPLVSPEPGQVVARAFQSSAGNYVVVRLAASGHEAVFMHLQKPSWARIGTSLTPGQQIGRVGQTGNAQGCHLHFELWTPPGWYKGGAPYDPLSVLQTWA